MATSILSRWLTICFITFSVFSCSQDEDTFIEQTGNWHPNSEQKSFRFQNDSPYNSLNPYDSIGITHNLILEEFLNSNLNPKTITEIIQTVNNLSFFNSSNLFQTASNLGISHKIEIFYTNPEYELYQEIYNSHLSNLAKLKIIELVETIFENIEEDYPYHYNEIILFESIILNNTNFSQEDKRVLLTFSSLIRHSLYFDKRRDDKDWVTSVTNFTGKFFGALESSESAIYWSLIMGICNNFLPQPTTL